MKSQILIRPTKSRKDFGGKASNLIKLDQLKCNVPQWVVIPANVLLDQLPMDISIDNAEDYLRSLKVPSELFNEMPKYFGKQFRNMSFAVRSSAMDEDGSSFSFAGQYDTLLGIGYDQLEESILAVWKSIYSKHLMAYRQQNGLKHHFGMAVIIQEMIHPDVSGVAFGSNPVSGNTSEKLVSSVYGLGEGLVSGELDADHFILGSQDIQKQLAKKKFAFNICLKTGQKTKTKIHSELQLEETLNTGQLEEIEALLNSLNGSLGQPQDIEFAYVDHRLYLLQTRPITTSTSDDRILWDNSNIVESYPGVTTPLTFSFISKMYEGVYKQLSKLLGISNKSIRMNEAVFQNTLGLVRGRVYYNLKNWYKMLALLPGYSINAKFMESMMGVKERFDLGPEFRMSKSKAIIRVAWMLIRMLVLHFSLSRQRRKFQNNLNAILLRFNQKDFNKMTVSELTNSYQSFESELLAKWNAPLVNDFFSMIWFGLLKKKSIELFGEKTNIHNDLLCGSMDIISVEPVKRSLEIASIISQDAEAKELVLSQSPEIIWDELGNAKHIEIKRKFDLYFKDFGERCLGELKLETISYSQDPTLFVQIIKSYVLNDITQRSTDSSIQLDIRSNAEAKINSALKGKFFQRLVFKYVLKKARELVSNRENLRYDRTKAFGMVRTMFYALGKRLKSNNQIEESRDVFYLELIELLKLNEKDSYKELLSARKKLFGEYATQKDPQERFSTNGMNFTDEHIYSIDKIESVEGDLKGVGCCPGLVKASVRIVRNPRDVEDMNGQILVAKSTDPGWVTLFPSSSGIIVERGSLLSHSAIVSREMGIPCIVSVDGLLRTLKDGDEVLMDGSSGIIKKLN